MSVAWEAPAEAARCGGPTARHRVTRSFQYFPYTDLTAAARNVKKYGAGRLRLRRYSCRQWLGERSGYSGGNDRGRTARAKDAAHRGQRSDDARPTVRTQYADRYAHRYDPNFDKSA
jgi:hypothetical protein